MDVKIVPMPGCLWLLLAVCTLGVAPLIIWLKERNWPRRVDEQGLVTRGGRRIAWGEFTGMQKVYTRVQYARVGRYGLYSPQGTVALVTYRLVDGAQVLDYIWRRLPEAARGQP